MALVVKEGAIVPIGFIWEDWGASVVWEARTIAGTATEADYSPVSASGVGGPDGAQMFSILIKNDNLDEPDEQFSFYVAVANEFDHKSLTLELIIEEDTLECVADLDGDGVQDQVELTFSQARQNLRSLDQSMLLYRQQLEMAKARIDSLIEQDKWVTAEGAAELISALANLATLGVTNTAVRLITGIGPLVTDAIKQLVFNADPQQTAENVWFHLLEETIGVLADPSWLPFVNMFEGFGPAFDINEAKIEIQKALAAAIAQKEAAAASLAEAEEKYFSLLECLGPPQTQPLMAPLMFAPVDPSTSMLEYLSSDNTPEDLFFAQGGEGADLLESLLSSEQRAFVTLGGGDDRIVAGQGVVVVDAGAGKDEILLLQAEGEWANRSDVLFGVGAGASTDIAVFGLKSGAMVYATGAELVVLGDGYYALKNGIVSEAAFAPAALQGITNILRISPTTDLPQLARISLALADGGAAGDVFRELIVAADNTTAVATMAYQFFTGSTPTLAGLDYLVSPAGPNPNNLNSEYYQHFNIENRYINFSVNLGKYGEGQAAFSQGYGDLSLFEATRKAYAEIFGATPSDVKVEALLAGGRDAYFEYYGRDGLNGLGTKAAMVGWLLSEAAKADVGLYARANNDLLVDLADGAQLGVDLIATYGKDDYIFLAA